MILNNMIIRTKNLSKTLNLRSFLAQMIKFIDKTEEWIDETIDNKFVSLHVCFYRFL